MPTYMDMHDIPGVKASDVAKAHEADVRTQGKYGVDYREYWVDEADGKVFCLVDAPDRETATRVHREAHGLEAHTLYEVTQGGLSTADDTDLSTRPQATRKRLERLLSCVPAHFRPVARRRAMVAG